MVPKETKTKLDPQAYSPMSACRYVFPANSCQNTSAGIATFCKYLFTVVFSFNLWLSIFLSNVRMGSKPQKSFCEPHGLCYSLKEDKVTGCTALICITCQGLFILGQRRVSGVSAGYLWSSFQDDSIGIGSFSDTGGCGFSSPKKSAGSFLPLYFWTLSDQYPSWELHLRNFFSVM